MTATVLQLRKNLKTRPVVPEDEDHHVRNFTGPHDIPVWLEIRRQAFATERPVIRSWSTGDFVAEVLEKPWWSPQRMWLAFNREHEAAVGSVICAMRGKPGQDVPVVHWLAVVPAARRAGVGQLLMAHLEAYCWQQGYRTLQLETHV